MMDMEKLERLACLSLTEAEREHMRDDLNRFCSLAESLLTFDGKTPFVLYEEAEAETREDCVAWFEERESMLCSARRDGEGYLTLPRIMGEITP